jgi:2-polyprenyl-3-methyl-5-hydroxy-6-metoxy-1,4-benzoquinol methylase
VGLTGGTSSSREQQRWDQYGAERLVALNANPGRFVVTNPPYAHKPPVQRGLMTAIGDVAGDRVVDLGCGIGHLSVYLATQGARVTGLDIGANLVEAARRLAEISGVRADFERVDIKTLPFPPESVDLVVGIDVLHHLSEQDLALVFAETHRVLRPGGRAIFTEPVEDSRTFNFVQNLVPAGNRGDEQYRPSWLQRREWARYVAVQDQRHLTTDELRRGGDAEWGSVQITPYGLTSRLDRLLPARFRSALWSLDDLALRRLPPLRRFCRTVLVSYAKSQT